MKTVVTAFSHVECLWYIVLRINICGVAHSWRASAVPVARYFQHHFWRPRGDNTLSSLFITIGDVASLPLDSMRPCQPNTQNKSVFISNCAKQPIDTSVIIQVHGNINLISFRRCSSSTFIGLPVFKFQFYLRSPFCLSNTIKI